MNVQSIQVTNSSDSHPIYLKLTPPENANVPEKSSFISISPKSTENIAVQGSIMNMFVWMRLNYENLEEKVSDEVIWKGVIPTKVNKTLIIDPEGKKVIYDGMELPDNFQVTTILKKGKYDNNVLPTNCDWWTYFIVSLMIVLIIVGIFYGLWYRRYLSSKGK